MDTDCDICQFLANKPLENQVITTEYWTVGVLSDQPYLGRAIITLLTHKGSLGELTREEWLDFSDIVKKLEPAYEKAFGAKPLNMGCFMNHGYRDEPSHPHVHWHIFPRYKNPVEFAGIVFKDERYGEFYNDDARLPVDAAIVRKITEQLKSALTHC